jgi:hypothetical protein
MAKVLTKKSALFLKSGATLPTLPNNFLEIEEELLVTPNITVEEYARINGRLGSHDSYAVTDFTTLSQTVSTKMRFTNAAATALETPPEYGELLKIGGFTETIDTGTADEETVTYTNTQAPVLGSAVMYIDGWKHESENSLAADLTFNFPIGKAATISAALSAYLDNKGVPTSESAPTITLNPESVMVVGKADIMTAGGGAITPDNVTIAMGATITEFQGMGKAEFEMMDYKIMVTADFWVDNANYAADITKLGADTVEAIVIKLGTAAGVLVNGKSVQIDIDLAKVTAVSDTGTDGAAKRTVSWLLQAGGTISILQGFFA